MTELILARHGETEWNVEKVFRGRIDVGLNEAGLKQAELLGEYLSQFEIEKVFSSPLKRALRTAQAIADYQRQKVEVTPALTDFDFGDWQGLSLEEVRAKYGSLFHEWLEKPHEVEIPGGESLDEVRRRALSLAESVLNQYGGRVVFVSHRVVAKVLICALLGLDNSHFWNIRLDTCGITTFSWQDGRLVLAEHNNTSYLRPLKGAPLGDF